MPDYVHIVTAQGEYGEWYEVVAVCRTREAAEAMQATWKDLHSPSDHTSIIKKVVYT